MINIFQALYAKEKANTELLIQKHSEEIKEKEALIETMKARIQEIPSTWDMKVRALEVIGEINREQLGT